MSYRPPGQSSNPGGYPPPGRGNFVSPGQVRLTRRGSIPWLIGCGLIALGFVLGVVGLFLGAILYFGAPASSTPLPARQPQPGTSDITATVSEGYINTIVAQELNKNPQSIAGIISVKEIVVKVLPNEQIQVDVRVGNALVDFDISVTENIGVVNGKLEVRAVGEPKVGRGTLPVNVNSIIETVNNLVVEPQLNLNALNIKVNNQQLRLTDIQTTTGSVIVRYRAL
jgi:hypothetical protein